MAARAPLSPPSLYLSDEPEEDSFTAALKYFDSQWANGLVPPPPPSNADMEDFGPQDPPEAVLCGWLPGLESTVDNPAWTAEDGSDDVPPIPEEVGGLPSTHVGFGMDIGNLPRAVPQFSSCDGSENVPPTMEADLPARSDDADDEVSFDFDEYTPGVVWYSPWRGDEEEEEEETDEVEAEEGEGVAEEDPPCVARPVSPDTLSDDDGEEEDVAEESEDIVPIPVSDPTAVLSDDEDTCPTPPSVRPSHSSEDVVTDRAPTSSLKSRLRRQKRPRSDDDGSDDDGDDSGDYGQPIRRPRKKTRRTLSPLHLDRQTASPVPAPETPSTSDAPGRHNEGGMTAYRVCSGPAELKCGVPGCKEILRESELTEARMHYRDHYKGKTEGTSVTCNWSGCDLRFTLDLMQSQRHLQERHFGMLYECPKCKTRVVRGSYLKIHIGKCRGPRGVPKKAAKGAGKSGGGRGRRRK